MYFYYLDCCLTLPEEFWPLLNDDPIMSMESTIIKLIRLKKKSIQTLLFTNIKDLFLPGQPKASKYGSPR